MSILDRCKEQLVGCLINTAREVALPMSTTLFIAVDLQKERGCMHGAAEEGEVIPGHLDLINLNFVKLILNSRFWENNFV